MQKQRSFFSTLAAVAWSFVGLRRKKDFDADADGAINPLYVVIAALVGLILFIGTLLFFVSMAVRA